MEGTQEILAALHEQPTDVVGLEEPLVGIDRERVGSLEGGQLVRLPRGQPGGCAVRRVDMEPQALALGEVGERGDIVDRSRVRGAGDGADGERCEPGRAILGDRRRDGPRAKTVVILGRNDPKGAVREAEEVDRTLDREVGLVGSVDPRAFEPRSARQLVGAEDLRQVHVPSDREGHDVRHHTAAREDAPCVVAVPAEVAEPADHLLLDEGCRHPREPHVDALVQPLREGLARDRHRKTRRREVAVRARVLRGVCERSEALAELREHVVRRPADRGRGSGRTALAEERLAQLGVEIRCGGAICRRSIEPVEGLGPCPLPEAFERRARPFRVAEIDQLGLGMVQGFWHAADAIAAAA